MNRRDVALDLTLESEARSTLILIGLAIGVLVLGTIVFLLWRKLRETTISERVADEEKDQAPPAPPPLQSPPQISPSEPNAATTTTMPIANESFRPEHPYGYGNGGINNNNNNTITIKNSNRGRLAAVFGPASIRKQLTIPHPKQNIQVYRGANGVHTPPTPNFNFAGMQGGRFSPAYSQKHRVGPHRYNPPRASQQSITPHDIAWMALADAVVGQHPHAKPLYARVPTQAEVDMITGHVHIPWAFKNDPSRPQPTAVKVLRPVVHHPAVPPPVFATPLHNSSGNVQRRDVSGTSSEITLEKRSPKGKSARRGRGKENTPPTAASGSSRSRGWRPARI